MDADNAMPRARLLAMINAAWMTQAIGTAVQLGLPDRLAAPDCTGCTAATLAHEVGADPDALARLLRALATVGVLHESADGTFALGATGQLLCTSNPGSLAAWALLAKTRLWPVWTRLETCVRTGRSAREATWGGDDFSIFDDEPEAALVFHQAMVELTRPAAAALAAKVDWSSSRRVVDIGGGSGALIAAVLAAHPHLEGVLFDLSHATGLADATLREAGVLHRCERVAGDFFRSVPAGADTYLLKSVLHDWDDAGCARILATCRDAMARNARMLVIERVVPDRPGTTPLDQAHAFSDLNMLVSTGGRERREAQFRALLDAAGLRLSQRISLTDTLDVLEARPTVRGITRSAWVHVDACTMRSHHPKESP